jgi:monoamine oxidase
MHNEAADRYDVVVIGAGFTGLRAATSLAATGLDVVVLEARDRVGGKVEARPDELGAIVDTGGQFICDDMPHVLTLVRDQGKHLVEVADPRPGLAFFGDHPTDDPVDLDRRFEAGWETWEQLASIAPAALTPGESTDDWLAAHIDDDVTLRAARAATGSMMCMPISSVPAANMAHEASRTPLTVHELQYIVAETMHQVAVDLAATLPLPVRLRHEIDRIERRADGVAVIASTPGGTVAVEAREVLLAIPPAAVPHIAFEPPLPDELATTAAAYRAGDVFKFLVRYEAPVWHRDDVSALRRFLDPAGLYCCEASPGPDRHTLVGFLGGPGASSVRSLSPGERRTLVLERLAEAYGPAAAEPVSFLERDWRPDRWGAGGYCNELVDARLAPPHADAIGVLRAGTDRISFASTELAAAFPGYVEGALRAGADAAERVLQRLRG